MSSICTNQKVEIDLDLLITAFTSGITWFYRRYFKPGFVLPKVDSGEFMIKEELDVG